MPSESSSSSKSSSSPAELTVFNRVACIPLIAWTIDQVGSTLEKNPLTSYPYATAKGLSATAYNYARPLQVRLAPAISLVDGYANNACDLVESRFPSVNTKPEEVAKIVHERRQSAAEFFEQRRLGANKTIDEKVKTPAFSVACEVDKRFTPFVDYLESTAATRLNTSTAPADTQYQYQRVYVLSKNVTGQLYEYSNQNILVQRASRTADSITALASSANSQINTLTSSAHSHVSTFASQLQQVQTSITDKTTAAYHELGDCIGSVRDIVGTSNLTLNDKVARIAHEIEFRIRPVLSHFSGGARTAPAATNANPNGNGHAQ
ncbi:hypothetical protein DFH08DRAFT_720331 [Mycena albidolilacea]|uniref:Uncharacterized protein n=1 Tax=Mycena albidolilacea TaxID=1033008 RepID=A0AAD7EAR7_9AGAR|nr:hypothetical protein DFH08DRAFT_720331 [Mycena albidolilacea]